MSWKSKYDYVGSFFHDDKTIVKLNNKIGVVDKNGKLIVPIIFDTVMYFRAKRAAVTIGSWSGYIDENGKITEGWHNLIIEIFS